MALRQIDPVDSDDRSEACMDDCLEAVQACEWCTTACVREGDAGMNRCIELCRDVADVAMLHARMLARDSDYSADLAETCAELCEACADECEQHDAEHCQTCADVVRECAETCRDVAA